MNNSRQSHVLCKRTSAFAEYTFLSNHIVNKIFSGIILGVRPIYQIYIIN